MAWGFYGRSAELELLPWLETLYLPGWRWLDFNYWGAERPAPGGGS